MTYCGEMGCDWEGLLNSIPEKLDLAALLTLPRPLIRPGTSGCAAGVEVPADYSQAPSRRLEAHGSAAVHNALFSGDAL